MVKNYFKLKNLNLINFCTIFVVLIPPSLVSGPFIPDLFISIGCILFIYLCSLEKKFYYFNTNFFKIFLIFWIYLIINSLFSDNFIHSFKISFFYIRFGIFCILINYLIDNKKNFINIFFYTLLFTLLFVSFDAYLQFFLGKNLFGFVPLDYPRISGLFGEELVLGSYLSRILPLAVGLFFLKKINIKIILVFLIFIEILIVISGERTAVGLIGLSTVLFILFVKGFKVLRIVSLILVLIFSSIILSQFTETKNRVINHTFMELGLSPNKQVQINFEGVEPVYKEYYIFSPKHQSLIFTSINMFKDKYLLGHGSRAFKYKCSDPKYQVNQWSCATHPHNIVAQILSEIGLIGLIFYLLILIYFLYFFYTQIFSKFQKKNFGFQNYKVCLVICMILSIWPLYPSGNIFNNWLSIIFYLPVGFYLNSINYTRNGHYIT